MLEVAKTALKDFGEDDAMSLAAALAFYAALSLAPLLVILLTIASFLGEGTQQSLIQNVEQMVGPQAGQAIEMVIASTQQPGAASVAGLISLAALFFTASGVVVQLQFSLNRIWDVQPKPSAGVWNWIRKRLMAFAVIIVVAVLLIGSLFLTAIIGALAPDNPWLWRFIEAGIGLVIFTMLFALMYKYLPDVEVPWRDVWPGAIMTAVLFIVGKFAVGLYLSHVAVGSSYGAAGSLLVLLVWVYYSSILLFLGAEFAQARARLKGSHFSPNEHAQWAEHPQGKLHPA